MANAGKRICPGRKRLINMDGPQEVHMRRVIRSNGHALTAWLAVLYRRIGSEAGKVRQAGSKRNKASYLFIVLDKATLSVAAAGNARVCDTQLCAEGMGKVDCNGGAE